MKPIYEGKGLSEKLTTDEFIKLRGSLKPRILVCAPSNAAVDEIMERIFGSKFCDQSGNHYNPHMIRVGADGAPISDKVKPRLLENMVNNVMDKSGSERKTKLRRIKININELETSLDSSFRLLAQVLSIKIILISFKN